MSTTDGIFLSRLPSTPLHITVGNGNNLPVSSRGTSTLATPHSNFVLNNVLVVASLIRNLLSVRQFTRDNHCSIEFDAMSFCIKTLHSGQVTLRGNSDGDFYTFPTIPGTAAAHANLALSIALWHRRLSHPVPNAVRTLQNMLAISCNKPDNSLCHAC
jgi:hypothetical protein